MRRFLLALFGALAIPSAPASAGDLPPQSTYLIYVGGRYAGKSAIRISEKRDTLYLDSKSKVSFHEFSQELECRTIALKKGYAPLSYEYKGNRAGKAISGTLRVSADSLLRGDLVEDGNLFPSSRKLENFSVLLENYVPEHQILLLRAARAEDTPYRRFDVIFPMDFVAASAVATLESEVELPTRPQPTVCQKYRVAIQNSPPFFTYCDPESRLPIYLDFPGTMAEFFLESAFGKSPVSRYFGVPEPEK